MTNNTKGCALSFKHRGVLYSNDCWNLLQADFTHKYKEYAIVGGDGWRQLAASGSFYSIVLNSIMRSNQDYDGLLAIIHGKKPHNFTMEFASKWCLSGMFIINRVAIERGRSGLLNIKINFESHGEIKNE